MNYLNYLTNLWTKSVSICKIAVSAAVSESEAYKHELGLDCLDCLVNNASVPDGEKIEPECQILVFSKKIATQHVICSIL